MTYSELERAFEISSRNRMSKWQEERENNKGKSSAEKFVQNLMTNGERAVCDDTSTAFGKNDLPDYYEEELYKRGQRFFYKHIFGLFLGKFLGLISVLSQKSSLAILMMTHQSSSDFTAFRRYIGTMFHILIWYEHDFRPNSMLWKSLRAVKHLHNSASKRSNVKLFYRINQKDMAITQFGLMGFVLTRGEMIGVHNPSDEELKGFIHLWGVVGYILGIEEQYNICKESVEETKAICNELLEKVLCPDIKKKDPKFMEMSSYLTNGLWCTNPFLEFRVFMFYLDCILDNDNSKIVKGNAEFQKLTKREQFKLKLIVLVLDWMKYSVVRILLKCLQLHALFVTKYFPYLAFLRYGWKNSYVKVP